MAISRADLLKELLPGLNELFGMEYKSYERRQRETIGGNNAIHGLTSIHQPFGSIDQAHEGLGDKEDDTGHALR